MECVHVKCCEWKRSNLNELLEIIRKARVLSCVDCERFRDSKSGEPAYLCLTKSCCRLGCGRNHKGHAVKHFKANKTHHLAINVMSLQVWCYECDEFVADDWHLIRDLMAATEVDIVGDAPTAFTGVFGGVSGFPSANISPVGLYNSGNSCFINAALQIFLNCPTLIGFFRDNCRTFVVDRDRTAAMASNQPSVADHFMALVEAVNSPEHPAAVSPIKLIRAASHFNPSFHGYSQQDSMDFFRLVLDRLHEDLKYSVPLSALLDEGNRKNRRKSGRLAQKNGESDSDGEKPLFKSVVSETFGGILRSEVQCHKCNKVSIKDDQFFDLSLPLQPSPQASTNRNSMSNLFSSLGESLGLGSGKGMKLEGAFVNFCLPEVLDGKDRYFCEGCNQLVQSTKTLTLKSLPQVLCVQLKRFRHDSYFSSKMNNVVEYPVEGLDLRHFLHKELIGSPLSSYSEYDLLGIVNHRGSFNGGHYVAYCKNFATGKWNEFDDSRVREISESELSTVQAYLLFYIQKTDPDRMKLRQEIIKTIGMTPTSGASKFVSKQWYNRLLNCNTPGPIDSYDVICQHGNLLPTLPGDRTCFLQGLPDSEEFCDQLKGIYGELNGFGGILVNPEKCETCVREAKELEKRRSIEDSEVKALDSATIGEGEFWYLIDSNWLQRWNAFKSGLQPPPGPISNNRLFKSSTTIRDNLSRGIHYRGVNEKVWNYFWNVYGGGPVIKRSTINIYT